VQGQRETDAPSSGDRVLGPVLAVAEAQARFGDARAFRVAVLADELANPPAGGLYVLPLLEAGGWGAMLLPADSYETELAETLLGHVVEHVEELVRNRCRVVLVGAPARLVDLLAAAGVPGLPSIRPSSLTELKAFLATVSPDPPIAQV
jgi:hypothetical protein